MRDEMVVRFERPESVRAAYFHTDSETPIEDAWAGMSRPPADGNNCSVQSPRFQQPA
jgi:hypothetical protein